MPRTLLSSEEEERLDGGRRYEEEEDEEVEHEDEWQLLLPSRFIQSNPMLSTGQSRERSPK